MKMNKEYIIELIKIHSDNNSNENLNMFFKEKENILLSYSKYKKIFSYFIFSIYILSFFYFLFQFFNNILYSQKLDYLEGIYAFISFISLLFVFILNDFFNYFLRKISNKRYGTIKTKYLNNDFKKSLFEDLKLEEPILYLTIIENKLQEVQDENPDLLKSIYKNYNFINQDTKKYIHFLISQEENF